MSSTESQYLMSLENKEEFRGKWIAILDSKVIAVGENISAVYHEAMEKSKGRTPLFEHVAEKQDEQTLIL